MKIAVVDDLAQERNDIISLVTDYFSVRFQQFDITPEFCEYESGEEFLDGFMPAEFDLVLLDIYMAELTGIETAEKLLLLDKNIKIIFFTTSTEHTLDGYGVHALSYILKPVTKHMKAFYKALDYFVELLNLDKCGITIKTSSGDMFVLNKNIVYIESSVRNLFFHFASEIVQASGKYSDYSKALREDHRFLECYRNLTVNMDYIVKPIENDFLLKTGEKIPISRRRKAEVIEQYTTYFINRRGF